jgi:hypothetical protein
VIQGRARRYEFRAHDGNQLPRNPVGGVNRVGGKGLYRQNVTEYNISYTQSTDRGN